MSSWFWSWLPGLPSIDFALPSTIQRRFISFVLKKSLGHLLKPGQFDVHQIDSQIGSGFVQVKDLELNNEAINSLIEGLPITLHDGSISGVKARIPWPNPLTSTLGFSLESLHLVFHLLPASNHTPHNVNSTLNLADSVASVADSFIHNELTPREEVTLRESFHPDLASSIYSDGQGQNVPGGLDPFLSAPEDEEFQPNSDADPAGVSIFAALIERLLARFEFDAVDTKITIVQPGHTSFTLSVSEIRYGTETRGLDDAGKDKGDTRGREIELEGATRTITISGVEVTARNLHPPIQILRSTSILTPSTLSPHYRRSPSPFHHDTDSQSHRQGSVSPASSSSSLDEDTQFNMSQSLAFLPPRPSSPTSSVASSMYQSAISDPPAFQESSEQNRSRTPSPSARDQGARIPLTESHLNTEISQSLREDKDETILSFGTIPIVLRLTTPPPVRNSVSSNRPNESTVSSRSTFDTPSRDVKSFDKMQLTLVTGILACSFRAWHIRGLLDLVDSWTSHHVPGTTQLSPNPSVQSSTPTSSSFLGSGLDVHVTIKGVVLLLLLSSDIPLESREDTTQANFFLRPLVPPRLRCGYLRLHLEGLTAIASLSSNTHSGTGPDDGNINASSVKFSLSLSELSLFHFHPDSLALEDNTDLELRAYPILITDHHLPGQYPSAHEHPDEPSTSPFASDQYSYPRLPIFDVVNWTDEKYKQNGAKVALWRTKQKRKAARDPSTPSSPPEGVDISDEQVPPAVLISAKLAPPTPSTHRKMRESTPQSLQVNVAVAPLHMFVDLEQILNADGLLGFLNEIGTSSSSSDIPQGESGTGVRGNESESDDGNHRESEVDDDTPPATPRASGLRERERERQRERRRLEKLVMDDLNLDIDYKVTKHTSPSGAKRGVRSSRKHRTRRNESSPSIDINIPMIRIQIRCPPPPKYPPRSGALVFDLHDIKLSSGSTPVTATPRFADIDAPSMSAASGGQVLSSAQCRRIVVAISLVEESKATAIISLGSLDSSVDPHGLDPNTRTTTPPLQPRIVITKSNSSQKSSSLSPSTSTITALSVDIPSAHINISKQVLDSLQYWADDTAQLAERAFNDTSTEKADSRSTSLLGSRYFAKSQDSSSRSGSGFSGRRQEPSNETVVKIGISDAFIRLLVPQSPDEGLNVVRPFDARVLDLDVLIELKPEGKDETVITVGVMDMKIVETTPSNKTLVYLALTASRSLISVPKPLVKLRFTSLVVPETTAKESRIKLTLCGFTYNLFPDFTWVSELGQFVKAPPGAFESVIPSERTRVSLKIMDGSLRALAPTHPGSLLLYVGDLAFSTDIVGGSPDFSFHLSIPSLSLLAIDAIPDPAIENSRTSSGVSYWKGAGYALLAEISGLEINFDNSDAVKPPDTRVIVHKIGLRLHLCADTLTAVIAFAGDLGSAFKPPHDQEPPKVKREPAVVSERMQTQQGLMSSVDENAFKRLPEVGPAPDMIYDDLPTNLDYLDESFGTAAGLRELRDDDLDEFDVEETEAGRITPTSGGPQSGIISNVGGETVKILRPEGLHVIEHYFDTLPPDSANEASEFGDTTLRVRVHNADVVVFLYEGYDWVKTRKTIEEEVKEMRRRLAKIRQLVASGQTQDPSIEETSTLLFNSVYIGLEQDAEELEPGALIAAIDDELKDDFETASQSSWQSLRPPTSGKPRPRSARVHGKRLYRAKGPSIEFRLMGVEAEVDQYRPNEPMVSRTFATVKDLEILDHVKTSTWRKFLTELRSDSRGNVRETDSNMVRVELRSVRPVPDHPSEEARLRAKILPLRLYVDQDALDFLKKFFSFKDPHAAPAPSAEPSDTDIYFQIAEIFAVDLKLDYKPRRVDYRALREGKTIELMNFFHFDGAEMTLRHLTLTGVTGWPRMFDMLNDLWTPDVKATQLAEVISGVAPIRSVVNVGSGVADLVLLPIAQYKKDGRIVRGVQKGTTAFVKSTAMEAIKLGARLATGTQVILEQAEGVLGGQFNHVITTETVQVPTFGEGLDERGLAYASDDEEADLISKYAEQPMDVKEGVQSAYRSLQRNFNSAAQTILAVPMEVYERSGNEGPVRAVIRAVPIAVLKPMIGASEAVSKTLMGLQNTLDHNIRHENEAKYKQR